MDILNITSLGQPSFLKNVPMVRRIVDLLAEKWIEKEPWLKNTTADIHRLYIKFGKYIQENKQSWSTCQYHYYLAKLYLELGLLYIELSHKNVGILIIADLCIRKSLCNFIKINLAKRSTSSYHYNLTKYYMEYGLIFIETSSRNVDALYIANLCIKGSLINIDKLSIADDVSKSGISNMNAWFEELSQKWKYFVVDKRKNQQVQLLKVVDMVEEDIMLFEHNKYKTVDLYYCLRVAYHLTGNKKISSFYEKKQLELDFGNINLFLSGTKVEQVLNKETITTMIEAEISKCISLEDVYITIMRNTKRDSLSNLDKVYIERHYTKSCLKFWLIETMNLIKQLIADNKKELILRIVNSVNNINSFTDMCKPLNELSINKLLIENHAIIKKSDEVDYIGYFKKELFELIVDYSSSAMKELIFLETFINVFDTVLNYRSFIEDIQLKCFCNNVISFHTMLQNIIDVNTDYKELMSFQEASKCLIIENNIFLLDTIKEVMNEYIKPVEVKKSYLNGRYVIEVVGKNIVISDILQIVYSILRCNEDVAEVRFIGSNIINIDRDLNDECASGKNLILYTKTITVHNKVIWDVSGKDSSHIFNENAGVDDSGNGKQGSDGYAGESGGNVLINTIYINNPENLTIVSCGGKGSNGQDGGNGADGKDEVGISARDFQNTFPSIIKFACIRKARGDLLIDTMDTINKRAKTVNINWSDGYNRYLKVKTRDDSEITFSSCKKWNSAYQGFLIYGGPLGKRGGTGGEFGVGAENGYSGEFTFVGDLKNIKISNPEKEKATNGKGGLYGCHGNNGWDMAYMDYQYWRETEYYGKNENTKLELHFSLNSTNNNVYCSYNDRYARISSTCLKHQKERKYEERKTTRVSSKLENQAQAVKKKTISQLDVASTYDHHINSSAMFTIRNMKSEFDNVKQNALQNITENIENKKKVTVELGVSRNISFNMFNNHGHSFKHHLQNTITNVDIDSISKDDVNIEKIELPENLFSIYKKIEQELTVYSVLSNDLITTNRTAAYHITVNKNETDAISNDVLGMLSKYLFEDSATIRSNVVKYCKEEYTKYKNAEENTSTLRNVVQYFKKNNKIEESSAKQNENVFKCDKEEYNKGEENNVNLSNKLIKSSEYDKLKNRNTKLRKNVDKCFSEEYNRDMKREENNIIKICLKTYLLETINSEDTPVELKPIYEKFEYFYQNKDLAFLMLTKSYQKFNNDCYSNKCLFDNFLKYLENNGPNSRSYMGLLSLIYNVNIRIFDDTHLIFNHNPLSEKFIHLLYTGCTFKRLNIDIDHLYLDKDREIKCNLFKQIISNVNQMKEKGDLSDYLKQKMFLLVDDNFEDTIFNEARFMDDFYINKIVDFFHHETDKSEIKMRLELIKSEIIGNQGIFQMLFKRFSIEGLHISASELCFVINSMQSFIIEDTSLYNMFLWTIVAYEQKYWLVEMLLHQLENYFKRMLLTSKTQWRNYLKTIENKHVLLCLSVKLNNGNTAPISIECVEDILYLISTTTVNTVTMENIELSEWPYFLRDIYWISKLKDLVNKDELQTLSYYIQSLENYVGIDLVKILFDTLIKQKNEFSDEVNITTILSNFYNENWNLIKDDIDLLSRSNILNWFRDMNIKYTTYYNKERDIIQLYKEMTNNTNISSGILNKLYILKESVIKVNSMRDDRISKVQDINKLSREKAISDELILYYIDKAVELKRGYKLRDTQKLAILSIAQNKKSTLAQLSTGEGKTLIVVALSIIKSLRGKNVDIITSSSLLAKRDALENRDIYDIFKIGVSHNCSENIEDRKLAYSSKQVIYGHMGSFQRDYLLDRFYQRNVLGDRVFDNVIVDEVDCMLLDKGNNMLYLSHNISGLDKIQSVYIYIWNWINKPAVSAYDLACIFDGDALKEEVLHQLYGLITKLDFKSLDSNMNDKQANAIWECLYNLKVLNNKGLLQKYDYSWCNVLENVLPVDCIQYIDRVNYILKQRVDRDIMIHVPNYLKPFIEEHLDSWISSAKHAMLMKERTDYVVDIDRSGSMSDKNPIIIIIDRDTGTDQTNSQWDEALHQFLQLKHGCKLTMQSLKSVFISNVSFFKLYSQLFGLTGTLGSRRERDLLKDIHNVEFITIPTARAKQFREESPIICSTKVDWLNAIYSTAKKYTVDRLGSVLIICETIDECESIYEKLNRENTKDVHIYVRDFNSYDTARADCKLPRGQIIISTNLAGRGTDIKITEDLQDVGLHVCLTYLPKNSRIEQQAFGRTARNGNRGSGQLVLLSSNSRIIDMKKQRDYEELQRISEIKMYYENKIVTEEQVFNQFNDCYVALKSVLKYNKKITFDAQDIILESCLDSWAFWLDANAKCIKDLNNVQMKETIDGSLRDLFFKINNLKNPERWKYDFSSPYQIIKMAKYIAQTETNDLSTFFPGYTNNFSIAIALFDQVIKCEPHFSEAAHYYKSYALLNSKCSMERDLREAKKLFELHKTNAMFSSSIINKIKKKNKQSIIQINAYEKQQYKQCKLYEIFINSIDEILGSSVTSDSFVIADIDEETSEKVYNDLLRLDILTTVKVDDTVNDKVVREVSSNYGILDANLLIFIAKYKSMSKIFKQDKFIRDLKVEIHLPGREEFWKLLIDNGILINEVKYVTIDIDKLSKIDNDSLNILKKKKLEEQSLEVNFSQVMLYNQQHESNKETYTYLKVNVVKLLGEDIYGILKKKGLFSFNKKADIDQKRIHMNIQFPRYDNISSKDFIKAEISSHDTTLILGELLKQKVLIKGDKNDEYQLGNFDYFKSCLPSYPIYEGPVKALLHICFIYRLAINQLKKQILQKEQLNISLFSKPHRQLFGDLVANEIIILSSVNTKNKDITKLLKEDSHNLRDNVDQLVERLLRLNGSINNLENPACNLQEMMTIFQQEKVENEGTLFSLIGLDHLLYLGECRWTKTMLTYTTVVIILGICQIAVGAAIELYSCGIMTHIGGAFISDGISDIIYGISAYYSGYFSWKDYGKHKLQSIALTTLMAGIGGYICRNIKLSYFGNKLSGPSLEFAGRSAAQTTGAKLIQFASKKTVSIAVTKRILHKTIQGVGLELLSGEVNKICDNFLRTYCDTLLSKIMRKVKEEIENHPIKNSLKDTHTLLGTKKARELIDNVTKLYFKKPSYLEEIRNISKKCVNTIVTAIMQHVEKTLNRTIGKKWTIWASLISKANAVIIIPATVIIEIIFKVHSFMNEMNVKLKEKLNKLSTTSYQKVNDENYNTFELEIITQWDKNINESCGQIVTEHIIKPTLKFVADKVLSSVGTAIKKQYQECKDYFDCTYIDELKENYLSEMAALGEVDEAMYPHEVNHIRDTYHANLLKLLSKTRSAEVFAKIVREGVPMDFTCVEASVYVVHQFLKNQGVNIDGLTVIVEEEHGIRRVFTTGSNNGETIYLQLRDNHYSTVGSEPLPDGVNGITSLNDCLFETFVERYEIRMTANQFREGVAKQILNDPCIKYHINQGHHVLPLAYSVVGDARADRPPDHISGSHISTSYVLTAKEVRKLIKTNKITFSQSSIGTATRSGMTIDELSQNMQKNGYKGDPIKGLLGPGGVCTVLDHRRTVAAGMCNSDDVLIPFSVYGHEDDFSSDHIEELTLQYKTSNAGEAMKKRMSGGSIVDGPETGFQSNAVRMRKKEGETLVGESSMTDMGLIVSSIKRPKRSISYTSLINIPEE